MNISLNTHSDRSEKKLNSVQKKVPSSSRWEIIKKVTLMATLIILGAAAIVSVPPNHKYAVAVRAGIGLAVLLFLRILFPRKHVPVVINHPPIQKTPDPTPIVVNNPPEKKEKILQNPSPFFNKQVEKMDKIAENLDLPDAIDDQTLDNMLVMINEVCLYANYHEKQLQNLQKELNSQFGTSKTEQFLALDFIQPLLQPNKPLNDQRIQYLIDRASNYFYNQTALTILRQRFEQESNDKTIFDEVIKELKLKEFLNGMRRIEPEMQATIFSALQLKSILKKEQQEKQAQENFKAVLAKVAEFANRDLYLNEEFIDNQFKIQEVLSPLQESEIKKKREELRIIINKAFVIRQLQERGKLTNGNSSEALLLDYLGYDVLKDNSPYQNKGTLFQVIQDAIQIKLTIDAYKGSLAIVKDILSKTALEARLKTAGLATPLQRSKFEDIQETYQLTQKEMAKETQKYQMELPATFPLEEGSPNYKFIQQSFTHHKEKTLNSFFKDMIGHEKVKNNLANADLLLKNFREQFDAHILDCMGKNEESLKSKLSSIPTTLAPIVDFFEKWGTNLKVQMVQGLDDDHAVLGEGICFGLCHRLQMESIKNPTLSIEETSQKNQIGSIQRFIQGIHITAASKHLGILPPEIAQLYGVKEEGVFGVINRAVSVADEDYLESAFKVPNIKRSDALIDNLHQEVNQLNLNPSRGWLRLFLQGAHHTIAIRLDEENRCAWLFDPNVGYLEFEGRSFAGSSNQCLDCLKDLLRVYYPNTCGVIGLRTIPVPAES